MQGRTTLRCGRSPEFLSSESPAQCIADHSASTIAPLGHRPAGPWFGDPVRAVVRTTSYTFRGTNHAANLFALKEPGNIYTRIMNPTKAAGEERLSALEGGVGALLVSSGRAAETIALLNIAEAGDHIVSSSSLCGGTDNLAPVAAVAHEMGVPLVVDNSVAKPYLIRLIEWGADVVEHSATNPIPAITAWSMHGILG